MSSPEFACLLVFLPIILRFEAFGASVVSAFEWSVSPHPVTALHMHCPRVLSFEEFAAYAASKIILAHGVFRRNVVHASALFREPLVADWANLHIDCYRSRASAPPVAQRVPL